MLSDQEVAVIQSWKKRANDKTTWSEDETALLTALYHCNRSTAADDFIQLTTKTKEQVKRKITKLKAADKL